MDTTTKLRMATAAAAALDNALEAAGVKADPGVRTEILRLALLASLPLDYQVSVGVGKL